MTKNPNVNENLSRKQEREIIVLAHNIRSTYNIGSIFRTAEGFGVQKIILSGYSPFPKITNEDYKQTNRLPYLAEKIDNQIHKTALGAESIVSFSLSNDIISTIKQLQTDGYKILALEQSKRSIKLPLLAEPKHAKLALLLGEEVNGINKELLDLADSTLEIPMFGYKESFNVSVAAGIALYKLACE